MPLSPEQSKPAQDNFSTREASHYGNGNANHGPHEAKRRSIAIRPFSAELAKAASAMLEKGLRHHERKLNSKLLEILRQEFHTWMVEREEDFSRQLNSVPKQSREQWIQEKLDSDSRRLESRANRLLCDFLPMFVDLQLSEIERLKHENKEFRRIVSRVKLESELHHVILDYAAQLGANISQLKEDCKSLDLWLDEEAMNDRFLKQAGEKELLVVFALDRLGEAVSYTFQLSRQWNENSKPLSAAAIQSGLAQNASGPVWQRLNLENRILGALQYHSDARLRIAALKCIRKGLLHMPPESADASFDQQTRVLINRMSMDPNADVWIQCEAITISTWLDHAKAISFLEQRSKMFHGPDDIFVRRHVWRLLAERVKQQPRLVVNFGEIADPSPFVRQQIAEVALTTRGKQAHEAYRNLGLNDDTEQVRAAALACAIGTDLSWDETCRVLDLVDRVLTKEQSPFVLRTAFHMSVVLLRRIVAAPKQPNTHSDMEDFQAQRVSEIYRSRIEPMIRSLECNSESIPVRRWAGQTCEKLWAILDESASVLIEEVSKSISKTSRGKVAKLSNAAFAEQPEDRIGRALSVLAMDDFGYEVRPGRFLKTRIRRGNYFGFRLWRFWHEFTHTATDKRQALRHTTGRISTSRMRIQSQICGELSETKVPGEPLNIAADGTWRPFLPLLDDFVSLLNMGWLKQSEMNFYSSQGITRVKSPKTWSQRLGAFRALTFRFAEIAKLRNWNDDSGPPHKYINTLRELGFEVNFERYADKIFQRETDYSDDSVERFFETETEKEATGHDNNLDAANIAMLAVAIDQGNFLQTVWQSLFDFAQYFYSPFENTLPQLVVFTVVILLLFLGRHFLENYRFRKARRNIPLSLGGWGTRGKSGTERLKAALLGVMGHGLVSKTTGCEAMFIHGVAHGEPLEIPLFRPYDKATIWEQKNLIMLASKMNPSVFLWECMALTPSYVDVLQRQWTQDDIGTITNTYPDHEDVQGPAGHNVATTISGFVPEDSHLITTEVEMLPFVSESCRHANTSLERVGWLESGLVTDDVLDRFPYQEHPNNIALVAAMGVHLGCEYDYSLKAMADYLVPDLGVLKTHPVSTIKHRKIEFTNGCSANERFGCMGNWKRLNFDAQDPWKDPDSWICGVVNNRADRVPRSKVFAKLIVEDVNADRFFLIGSNLDGLQSFINEALLAKVGTMSLKQQSGEWNMQHALETLRKEAWNSRQPIEEKTVQERLQAMLDSVCDLNVSDIDANNLTDSLLAANVTASVAERIVELHHESLAALEEYQIIRTMIESTSASNVEATEQAFRDAYIKWYRRKIVVVPKFESTGEEVIARIVEEVPPGFHAKVMGLQNIKGTGLDFVYRFQAWDTCHEACRLIVENDTDVAQKGLNTLLGMPVIGQLCQEHVAETIKQAQKNPALKRADLQKQLDQIRSKLDADRSKNPVSGSDESGEIDRSMTQKIKDWVIANANQYLDVNDSLARRENADLIYRELAACRISRQRAIMELRKINKRQKS